MQSLVSPVTKALLVALFIFAILLILYVILWPRHGRPRPGVSAPSARGPRLMTSPPDDVTAGTPPPPPTSPPPAIPRHVPPRPPA
ncbi:uncharacterized protein LOC130869245 [Chionomys nivalis]|uniref:uncharacterized protein LOC130869245 n=1 Tax=Chionomys nivalis TaxID=269649 RepID=UPI002591ED1B|nr:uncharacterized protein LOC130869245 [Chionomys nivalis]